MPCHPYYGKTLPGARVTVQATKASVENLNLLQSGRGELAFTLGDSLTQAWEGVEEAGYKTPLKKLRTVAAIYPNYIQIVATAESGIKTLADLKGKRVSVGAPKSGTELNARAIFKAADLSYADMKVQYRPFGESMELMKNKQLDATLQSAGLGVASLRDLATNDNIIIVPVSPEIVAKTGDPAYIVSVVPANTYRGQTADVPTAAVRNFLFTHEGVPAGLAVVTSSDSFTLTWTHSVEKAEWREDWRITSGRLVLGHASVMGSGACMEPPPDAVLKDGRWVWQPQIVAEEIVLARSEFTDDWRLCVGGDCRHLEKEKGPTRLRACP